MASASRSRRAASPHHVAVAFACIAATAVALAQEELDEPAELEGWRFVARSSHENVYLRQGRVVVVNDLARAWVLMNLREPELDSETQLHYRSTLSLEEHDCREKRSRMLQSTAYAEPSGAGGSIFSFKPSGGWRYAIPDTVGERINSEVCDAMRRQAAKRQKKPAPAAKEQPSQSDEEQPGVQRL